MAPLYARYVPPKPAAPSAPVSAAAAAAAATATTPPKPKKAPKERSNSDEHGRKKRKRADVESASAEDAQPVPTKHTGVFSKFQKATQLSEAARAAAPEGPAEPQSQPELHDLTPLPQPARAPTPEFVPSYSSLPQWLAQPTLVSQSTTTPFNQLSLSTKTLAHLESKGYTTAFAVQSALLPLLLPHPYLAHLPPNDVCVSAPTGSGKTLAYVLPVVESLRNRLDTKLRAVIVVPTRELVAQAYAVASTCAHASTIQIALAVGNQSVAAEQESLVKKGRVYDPERYRALMEKAKKRLHFELDSDLDGTDATLLDDIVQMPPNYVPTYSSAADLLICTPGRLVEHLTTTTGFTLEHVEWLIVDEADRLLDQSFQEWVAKVTAALDVQKLHPTATPETAALRHLMPHRDRYVRKVILSATMTRDISKLSALKLRRPTMIVVKTEAESALDAATVTGEGAEGFELPSTLSECAVPVGDGSDKPLFLLELLRSKILPVDLSKEKLRQQDNDDDVSSSSSDDTSSDEDSDSSDDSSTDEDSDSSEDTSTDESDGSDSSSSDSSSDDSSDSESESDSDSNISSTSSGTKPLTGLSSKSPGGNMVLIFTPSTEAAARLHHLITHIEPSYRSSTLLLTKSSTSHTFKASSQPRIIISTDRASRGLDLPLLTHVINYTIPRSLASYVHRVGRTARAGKKGEAWTLFTESEGRWFWNEIARTKGVGRSAKVDRVNLKLAADQQEGGSMRDRYLEALESIKEIVVNRNSKPRKSKGKKDQDVEMAD